VVKGPGEPDGPYAREQCSVYIGLDVVTHVEEAGAVHANVFHQLLKDRCVGLTIAEFPGDEKHLEKRRQPELGDQPPPRGSMGEVGKESQGIDPLELVEHLHGAGYQTTVIEKRGEIGVKCYCDAGVIGFNRVSQLSECGADPETVMRFSPVFLCFFQEIHCAPAIGFFKWYLFKAEAAFSKTLDQPFNRLAHRFRVCGDEGIEEVKSDGFHVFQAVSPFPLSDRINRIDSMCKSSINKAFPMNSISPHCQSFHFRNVDVAPTPCLLHHDVSLRPTPCA